MGISSWVEGEPSPVATEGVDWETTGWQLYLATFTQICTMLAAGYLHRVYRYAMQNKTPFGRWIIHYLGTRHSPPKQRRLVVFVNLAQFVASVLAVSDWITQSYVRSIYDQSRYLDLCFGCFFTANYVLNAIKYELGYRYFTSLQAIIDVFTIVPIFGASWIGDTWLNFQYLRTYQMLKTYETLEAFGVLDQFTQTSRRLTIFVLRFVCLVVCFAATIFVLEVLGDIPQVYDHTFPSTMGQISFYQMCYWMVTTISTVGYGDFSPQTLLSRAFTMIFIISGVIFFSLETGGIMEIWKIESSGKGSYHPSVKGRKHVCVFGGGVRANSAILQAFLKELLHVENGSESDIDVVMMHVLPVDSAIKDLLEQPWVEEKLRYYVGSPARAEDQARVRLTSASMVVVLPDSCASDECWEDAQNMIRALSIHRACPWMRIRMLALRPESTQIAVSMGVPEKVCYSANQLKANLLAQSCTVMAWGTLVTNLFVSCSPEARDEGRCDPSSPEATWLDQYCFGEGFEIRGCCLAEEFAGLKFGEAARTIYSVHGMLLLGLQEGSQMLINPSQTVLQHGVVVFAMSQSLESMRHIADPSRPWQSVYEGTHQAALILESCHRLPSDRAEKKKEEEPAERSREKKPRRSTGKGSTGRPGVLPYSDPGSPGEASPTRLLQFGQNLRDPETTGQDFSPPVSPRSSSDSEDDLHYDSDEDLEVGDTMLRIMKKDGGHIVLLCCDDGMWQQVIAFLEPLRASYLPHWARVVVVSAQPPPKRMRRFLPQVCIITKAVTHPKVFHLAGLATAKTVVVMSGRAKKQDLSMIDSSMVAVANSLETNLNKIVSAPEVVQSWLTNSKKKASFTVMYEFHEAFSIGLLMPSVPAGMVTTVGVLDEAKIRQLEAMRTSPLSADLLLEESEQGCWHTAQPRASELWQGNISTHPRYAAGGLQQTSTVGSLLAMAYYTPGISRIISALLAPAHHPDMAAVPWLLACPELIKGKTYGQLFEELNNGQLCRAAFEMCKTMTEAADKGWGRLKKQNLFYRTVEKVLNYHATNDDEEGTLVGDHREVLSLARIEFKLNQEFHLFCPLAMGIYREAGTHGSELGYVMTCPPKNLELRETDRVYLLGSLPVVHLFSTLEELSPPPLITNLPGLVHAFKRTAPETNDTNSSTGATNASTSRAGKYEVKGSCKPDGERELMTMQPRDLVYSIAQEPAGSQSGLPGQAS